MMEEAQNWFKTFIYAILVILFSISIGMVVHGIKTEWKKRRNQFLFHDRERTFFLPREDNA